MSKGPSASPRLQGPALSVDCSIEAKKNLQRLASFMMESKHDSVMLVKKELCFSVLRLQAWLQLGMCLG